MFCFSDSKFEGVVRPNGAFALELSIPHAGGNSVTHSATPAAGHHSAFEIVPLCPSASGGASPPLGALFGVGFSCGFHTVAGVDATGDLLATSLIRVFVAIDFDDISMFVRKIDENGIQTRCQLVRDEWGRWKHRS